MVQDPKAEVKAKNQDQSENMIDGGIFEDFGKF